MSEFVLFRVILGTLGIAVFGIIFGLLYKGIDRKIAAHMQGRIGPPIRQPFRNPFILVPPRMVLFLQTYHRAVEHR